MTNNRVTITGIIVGLIVTLGVAMAFQSDNITTVNIDKSILSQESEQLIKPQAVIQGIKPVSVGTMVTLSAEKSESKNSFITKFEWKLDDKIISNKVIANYQFDMEGIFPLSLKVIDNDGLEDIAYATIEVLPKNSIISTDSIQDIYQKNNVKPKTYGPLKYLSFNDSPFKEFSSQSAYFYLEDFEDGVINQPGLAIDKGRVDHAVKDWTDSVDADDGLIDGFGEKGKSWFSQDYKVITITFDKSQLDPSFYPNYAGLVITSVRIPSPVTIEVYNSEGIMISKIGPVTIGDNQQTITDGDMFVGFTYDGGIKAIVVKSGNGHWELDHIQYGIKK